MEWEIVAKGLEYVLWQSSSGEWAWTRYLPDGTAVRPGWRTFQTRLGAEADAELRRMMETGDK